MTGFSFTAPQITPEEGRREREGLSDDERQSIEADLFGGYDTLQEETESMRQKAPAVLRTALSQIPVEMKSAYLEALEKAPDLVMNESKAIAFLRREKFDSYQAALRLIEYWKYRKLFFGSKAFLPMTIDGALSEDVDTLKSGFMNILPNDRGGRPVFYYDCVRHTQRDSQVRVYFYMLHVIAQLEDAQKRVAVVVMNCQVS